MREPRGAPRWARAWVERRLPSELVDAVVGDLEEEYRTRAVRSRLGADLWFWSQALTLRGRALRRAATRLRAVRPADPVRDGPPGNEEPDLATRLLHWGRDFRYALRRIARSPAFSAVAILSLSLGIGANTAMFSLVNAVLLRGLPVEAPERLVEIYTSDSGGYPYATSSYPDYVDIREGVDAFEGVVGTRNFVTRVGTGGSQRLAFGELVSWDYFDVLGAPVALGRSFRPDEDASPGTHAVAIVGYRTWLSDFGGDERVLGETVHLNGLPFTIVGVAHEDFTGSMPVMVSGYYVPLMMTDAMMGAGSSDQLGRRGSRSMFIKARLAAGVTLERANEELRGLSAALARQYPESNEARSIAALASSDVSLHPMVDRVLTPVAALLLAVVGLVLLIACANLASFLLARAEDRRREIAVRLALGAGRAQLTRQLLVEASVLALLGGAAGIMLANVLLGGLMAFRPPLPVPVDFDISLDGSVLLFTIAVSLVAGIGLGLAPALQATSPDLTPTLKGDARSVGARRFTLRDALVVAQVAFSFVLLIGAGLFVRSLQKAQTIDPGFDTGPAALVWPDTDFSGAMGEEERRTFLDEYRARLLAEPGVRAVAMADRLPLGAAVQTGAYLIPGHRSDRPDGTFAVDNARVAPGYFDAMGVPLVSGEPFTPAHLSGEPVAIVSEAFVARFLDGGDPVGRSFERGTSGQVLRIIGVARDTKVRTLGEAPRPYVYELAGQMGVPGGQVVVRGSGTSAELLSTALRVLREIDPDMPLLESKTMNEHLALLLFPPRMAALLLSAFGALALLLAAVGVYGVVSYAVSRRTREMGIRISLGASGGDVVRMAIGGGMRLVALGGVLGVLGAAGIAWAISGYLFGIGPNDAATFVAIPVLLSMVAFVAAWVPARRASRVDPVRALRTE